LDLHPQTDAIRASFFAISSSKVLASHPRPNQRFVLRPVRYRYERISAHKTAADVHRKGENRRSTSFRHQEREFLLSETGRRNRPVSQPGTPATQRVNKKARHWRAHVEYLVSEGNSRLDGGGRSHDPTRLSRQFPF
jgi:hypothetical protein